MGLFTYRVTTDWEIAIECLTRNQKEKVAQSVTLASGIKYNFKDKGDWKNEKQCYICEIPFSLKHSRHHCRLCANSVCGPCSKNKVTDNKVCDICWIKHQNPKLEMQKKAYLKNMSNWTRELDDKIANLKETISEKESQKERLVTDIETNNKMMVNRIMDLEKSLETLRSIYESKLTEKKNLEDAIRMRSNIMNESNSKLRDLEGQISLMEIKVQRAKEKYEAQAKKRDQLKKHLNDLIVSEQTLRDAPTDEGINLEIVNDLIKRSALLRDELDLK